ncbi:MerR family transcriptional regulator [Oceanobacillus sp. CFH 90083]|uniref:MerR family transcriptional regulator n=1 Tax=Oceanobacillus sp. CFH 90083 TaxID=2592336 RepID=UPI00128CB547|nr:MerR family transcriptional regulator [Oceanobacillus sp. CFH 90083]
MFTIKKAAEKLNIPTSTIRYYDDEGLLPFIERDENGYRIFQEEDLFWLEMIGCMRSTGMSIKMLQHIAQLHMQGEETLQERKDIFKAHQRRLIEQKQDIDNALDRLEEKMKRLSTLR